MTNYDQLIADALDDVEADNQHPCGTTEHCCEMGGCPRCFQAVMGGNIGVERVEVFRSGVIRLTTTGHNGQPCTVAFRGVEVTIHDLKRTQHWRQCDKQASKRPERTFSRGTSRVTRLKVRLTQRLRRHFPRCSGGRLSTHC